MVDIEEVKTEHSVEELARVYLKLRTAIYDLKEQQRDALQVLEEQMNAVSAVLLTACNALNADSIKTASGTVSRRVTSRYWTSDWGSMYEFIKEHDAPFLLEQRIHNGNMKDFLEDHPDVLPIGLQADRKFVIQVRKPTSK
jgi:hypothetical protein